MNTLRLVSFGMCDYNPSNNANFPTRDARRESPYSAPRKEMDWEIIISSKTDVQN